MLRQLPACPALPTFPASSSFSVPSLSSSLAPPVFPASTVYPASLALPTHTSSTPLRFPMFPLYLLLPCCLCLSYSHLFPMLSQLPYSAFLSREFPAYPTPPLSYYTIPRLLSSPVMRVLSAAASQSPTHHQGVNHLLCQLNSPRLDSRSVSQSSSHARQLCVCVAASTCKCGKWRG